MSTDLKRAICSYAEYLDEVLPAITVDDALIVDVDRPHRLRSHPVWYRRPTVVFIAAFVVALTLALVPVVLFGSSGGEVVERPSPTVPVTTTLPLVESLERAPFTLIRSPDMEPVRVPTAIGDFEFVTMRFPSGKEFVLPSDLMDTRHGPVAVDDGTLWWSTDHETWHQTPIGVGSARVTAVGDDIVIAGATGITRFSWDGGEWTRQSSVEFPNRVDHIAYGPRGVVVASVNTVYHSADESSFTEAERGPDATVFWASETAPRTEAERMGCPGTFAASEGRIRTVLATDVGFVALTSAAHPADEVCEPFLWFSPDGDEWTLVSPESPFGEQSVVRSEHPGTDIVERDGRFVAFGYQGNEMTGGAVWVSDDALTWDRVDAGITVPLTLDGGEMGWVLTGLADDQSVLPMWLSTDGYVWHGPYDLPDGLLAGYLLPRLAVGSDTIYAIGPDEQIVVVGRLQSEPGDRS